MKINQVTMSDGSRWNVPVEVIARSHAQYYAKYETNGDVEAAHEAKNRNTQGRCSKQ